MTNSPRPLMAIIDYELGNLQSVYHALRVLGSDCRITRDPEEILRADGMILPGVGAFAEGMANLKRLKLDTALHRAVLDLQKPILGICLGMQLFAEASLEYGRHQGLGWIPGEVLPLKESPGFKVPQVGWNNLCLKQKAPLFLRTDADTNFYFDHSYSVHCRQEFVAATCFYSEEITAAVQSRHLFGVQFHPEKSQFGGLKLLRCFLNHVQETLRVPCSKNA